MPPDFENMCESIGSVELPVEDKSIMAFCESTGHDFNLYSKANIIPQGYLMTLTIPLVNRFFMQAVTGELKGVVKGVIHTNSVVEYRKPMSLDGKYAGRLSIANVEEKKGRLGDYIAVDFKVSVTDDKGEVAATDIHQFFMRT